MTPAQFYIGLAVPTLMVLVGILMSNQRINDLNNRLTEMSRQIDTRLADLRSEMTSRIDGLCDTLRAEMARNHSELLARIADVERR